MLFVLKSRSCKVLTQSFGFSRTFKHLFSSMFHLVLHYTLHIQYSAVVAMLLQLARDEENQQPSV